MKVIKGRLKLPLLQLVLRTSAILDVALVYDLLTLFCLFRFIHHTPKNSLLCFSMRNLIYPVSSDFLH